MSSEKGKNGNFDEISDPFDQVKRPPKFKKLSKK